MGGAIPKPFRPSRPTPAPAPTPSPTAPEVSQATATAMDGYDARKTKAKKINLSEIEVGILASIVQAETNHLDEASNIAGVYMNRLNKKMYLAADPTLVYAHNDFSIKRVLNIHKKINSPYNTYRNKGLPPGPINMPEKTFIDAVLNYNNHNYYFFCAKDDFSGYHVFATNLKEHNRNAKKFHRELNKRKIYR